MTELRVSPKQGETLTIHVDWLDENAVRQSFPIEIEIQEQDRPRLVGVKVMHRPVLLRANDIVFHSGSPLDTERPEIVDAIVKNFRCFGGGRVSDSNPVAHWTKDAPPMFAMGVDVADVVRFVIDRLNGGRS